MAFLFYFQPMNHVCLNGKILPAGQPVLLANNKSFRYGDGLFETMKLVSGRIILEEYHFDRLFQGIELLQFHPPALFTTDRLRQEIVSLCEKNRCNRLARVRLSVFRGNGGIYDDTSLEYLIESWPLELTTGLNKNGLDIDIYPDAQKSCDRFSNIKSANYLPYVMAAHYAQKHKLNDCLITNTRGHIADATIANLFLVKNQLIITPSLSEGCVQGVMRRWLVEKIGASPNFELREGVVTKNDLETFDEVFLTNAIHGLRWVKSYREKTYANTLSQKIYNEYIAPLYQ